MEHAQHPLQKPAPSDAGLPTGREDTPTNSAAPDAPPAAAFAQCPVGLGVVTADSTLRHACPVLAAFGGYRPDELAGKPLAILQHPDEGPAYDAFQRTCRATGMFAGDFTLRRRDGSDMPVTIYATVLPAGQAGPADILMAVVDAEPTRETQRALRENAARLQLVTIATQDAIYDWHLPSDHAWCNDRHVEWLGETENQRRAWWTNALHPDDRPAVLRDFDAALADTGPRWAAEYRLRRADGAYAHVADRGLIVRGDDGRPTRIIGALTDITARTEVEQALRFTQFSVDRAGDGVLWLTRDARIAYVNDATCQMLGYTRAELLGHYVFTIDFVFSPQRWEAHWQELREHKTMQLESEGWHRSGRVLRLELTANYVEYAGRAMNCLFIRDVSRRKAEEERARAHQAELAHVARLATLGELAAGIAHELNQPLSAVVTFAEACLTRLQSGAADPAELLSDLQDIIAQGQRAGDIIHRLRGFVRRRQTQAAAVDPNTVVRDVLALLRAELRLSQVEVRVELGRELPPVLADRIQIEQVLVNLLRNAIEALTAADGPTREIVISTRRADGARLEFAVADNGPGLRSEEADRVGEPFFTTKERGLGLGLSISNSIVEAHGGKLWAEANPGGGAVFHFTLPLATSDIAAVPSS